MTTRDKHVMGAGSSPPPQTPSRDLAGVGKGAEACCVVSLVCRYDSEGHLTNVTYPTGVVISLHYDIERSISIDIESSKRDNDVSIVTNLSSVEASYTVVQGEDPDVFTALSHI